MCSALFDSAAIRCGASAWWLVQADYQLSRNILAIHHLGDGSSSTRHQAPGHNPPASLIQGSRAGAALLTMWENGMSECAPKAGAGVFKAVV